MEGQETAGERHRAAVLPTLRVLGVALLGTAGAIHRRLWSPWGSSVRALLERGRLSGLWPSVPVGLPGLVETRAVTSAVVEALGSSVPGAVAEDEPSGPRHGRTRG
jgi:hypothetical protein